MTSIYLVLWWDGFQDSSDYLMCCFLDKEQALLYASEFPLAHEETITVELRYIGYAYMVEDVYMRECYDHTRVLFDLINWEKYDLTFWEVVAEAIRLYSPMCVDIDWDRLYYMYQELGTDED